ncbi:MAG: SDR family oxidoreductase [Desulfobacteraceae bacterium]|jgi:NAD(P)-dependent dehydrogenase (short-subunit alcohol dehydrogenase family)
MELPDISKVFDIKGKVALITGATGGFGKIACQTMAAAGAKVMVTGRSEDKLKELAEELKSTGADVSLSAGSPDNYDDVKKVVADTVKAFGGIDILITAAGVNMVGPIAEQPIKDWQTVMNANYNGTYFYCKEVGKVMIEQGRGGKVINVSSARGNLGMAGYTAYSPSKAAVNLLTKSLGCEWGQYKINVNAVAPTVFRTALTQWMFDDKEFYKNFLRRIPIGRLGEPNDFVGLLLMLSSSASDFMTGTIIDIDGGYAAG